MLLNHQFITALKKIFSEENIFTDSVRLQLYSHDTSRHMSMPDVVVFPQHHDEVVAVVKLCNEFHVPLTARGLGSGTPGGAVPIFGGVILSLEKMNRILVMDAQNRFMKVEAGVLNQTVQDEAKKYGLCWAPDPGSAAICTIGGNLAFNAAGPRAVKYGATRENVLALKAVIGTGETINAGANTTKGAVGYDLTRLFIGSEGTLGITTEATLKLIPLPNIRCTLRVLYQDMSSAVNAVINMMSQPHVPCALELLDHACLNILREKTDIIFPGNAQAMLLIDIDDDIAAIKNAANVAGLIEITQSRDAAEAQLLWAARKALSPAVKAIAPQKINEDIVVPVNQMPALFLFLEHLSQQYQIKIINFGHAGNGNIHVNFLIDPNNEKEAAAANTCLDLLFQEVVDLGGTLSGEHGIGIEKREYMTKAVDPATLQLMQNIKKLFDPKNILNPGKIFPQL